MRFEFEQNQRLRAINIEADTDPYPADSEK